MRIALVVACVLAVLLGACVTWTFLASSGHRYVYTDAPSTETVIVFGAKIEDGNPLPFLTGRLETTAALWRARKVHSVLVSGNASGTSGDETKAMTEYLVTHGVDRSAITVDPYGLDTYDTCARAVQVYGINRALLVTQAYHLPRAVSLCRNLGMDADGVASTCDCGLFSMIKNRAREVLATVGAVRLAIWNRPPAVSAK
ncbi:ElyC/SanA/YdcF family protein [Actinocrispum sp. NPDC049592]|uniref:SanA/YdcF family protein n=1 Tax=Actinocrispum sp. NPDC049592 TaxID=3154835 RepID=UPI00341F6B14